MALEMELAVKSSVATGSTTRHTTMKPTVLVVEDEEALSMLNHGLW